MTDLNHLSERVKRLEYENRLFKLAGTVLALGVLAFASLGAANKPQTIEAEKIILRDAQGHVRLTLGTPGTAGAAFAIQPNDPAIWLSDENGTDRAILTSDGLYFANKNSRPTVSLSSGSASGASSLGFYDPNGKIIRSIP